MNKLLVIIFFFCSTSYAQDIQRGFFDFEYVEDEGKVLLLMKRSDLEKEFLYVNSLSAGIGSNDIGLDRGQLGSDRIVKFIKTGNKLLLIQPNQDYRANSDNELERKAVEEAFAQSVIWGFKIEPAEDNIYKVDITDFLLRDAHGVSEQLKRSKQGSYKIDNSRSAIWMDRTKAFPKNTEFDAILTFTGKAEGRWIRSVTPSSDAITVHQHHSFIELPDSNYKPRKFHPFGGYFPMSYYDYAVPIEDDIQQRFIYRHRLEKKNPKAAISEAKEPIVYYIDPGCPDPIKTALMQGAVWWDQAFMSAGYSKGTFQIKELPAGADLMDVRYNVIQWVHRSTRGWSYGSSVSDPRTGEIIKGHVSLGSLRVRQDFLIAQGLLSPYGESNDNHDPMLNLALARLRQLAAHEIGHTIGLAHNFAASYNNRASVMDYPHPLIDMDANNKISFSKAYDDKIGLWDKFTIAYGYQDFPDDVDEHSELIKMVEKQQQEGFLFLSDSDARPSGGAHPNAHLWDNGDNAVDELNRLMTVRKEALDNLGEATITIGTPLSELEKVLVPVYLLHRYQIEAVSKLIGGVNYQYFVKGDGLEHSVSAVDHLLQGKAVEGLLSTLLPENLRLPEKLLSLIPPSAYGYGRSNETFKGKTNLAFDPLSTAESHIKTTFEFLLNKDRLARIHRQNVTDMSPIKLEELLQQIGNQVFSLSSSDEYGMALIQLVQKIYFSRLIQLSFDNSVDMSVASLTMSVAENHKEKFLSTEVKNAHTNYLNHLFNHSKKNPSEVFLPKLNEIPPGSPIGCDIGDYMKN